MKYRVGNLLDLFQAGEYDVIVHGCNTLRTMGAGIAAEIARRWPEVEQADKLTEHNSRRKLGKIQPVLVDEGFIVNMYTQLRVGSGVQVDYGALEHGFYQLKLLLSATLNPELRIGIPMIGAGLAGGDWAKIEKIIDGVGIPNLECVVLDETLLPGHTRGELSDSDVLDMAENQIRRDQQE